MSANRAAVALAILVSAHVPVVAAEPPDPAEVARRIDAIMAATWGKNRVVPAARADDAEFLRRVSLDIIGRIPTVAEVREFLADTDGDKRAKLVAKLLLDPQHHAHFARLWRDFLVAPGVRQPEEYPPFEAWLRGRFAENARYDRLARELVIADPKAAERGLPRPESLYVRALGTDAGNYAASTARVFLGVSLECARCHNHPFAPWTRSQFWQLAAVFEDAQSVPFRVAWAPRITIPDTTRIVMATLPDGTLVKETPGTPRDQFARWLARPENPYFAKATVNRVWAILLGSPLAELADDGGTPRHAAALDELARAFVQSGFDVRFLVRTITATRAYQFTSAKSHESQKEDGDLFARMALKPLSADQLADTLAVALGGEDPAARAAVLERFAGSNGEVTILQALWWMNGAVTARAASSSRTLVETARNDKLDTRGKVEELFLATLGRAPAKAERERLVKYVESGGPNKDKDRALADVFWALLNSTEFAVNR
jgi:hypothetical protein